MADSNSSHRALYPKSLAIGKVIAPLKFKRNIVRSIETLGNVEPISVDPRTGTDQLSVEDRRNKFEAYRTKISNYLKSLDDDLIPDDFEATIGSSEQEVLDYVSDVVDVKAEQIGSSITRQAEISDRINYLNGLITLLGQLGSIDVSSRLIANTTHTQTFLGVLFPPQLHRMFWYVDEVTDGKHFILDKQLSDQEVIVLISVLQDDAEAVQIKLNSLQFQEIPIPKDVDLEGLTIADCETEISKLEADSEKINNDLETLAAEIGPDLMAASEVCTIELQRVEVELKMRRTETTCILWVWLPEDDREEFRTLMHSATDGAASIDFRKGDLDPEFTPSYVQNSEFMAPMRSLVTSFGTPGKNEIDPYPFFKFLFPVMFAFMFADVGHGFLLTLVGLWAYRKKKKMKEIPEGISGYIYGGSEILIVMGIVSFFMGFPANSVFGDETILWTAPVLSDFLKPLFENTTWKFLYEFKNEEGASCDPYQVPEGSECGISRNYVNYLIFSFAAGAFVILLGLFLNIYQLLNYRHSDADLKAALTLTAIYLSAVFATIFLAMGLKLLGMLFVVAVPTFLVVTLLIEFKAHGVDGLMLGVDHVISLLSNTFSFGRLLAMNTIHFVLAFLPYLFITEFTRFYVLNHDVTHFIWADGIDIFIVWWIAALLGAMIVVPVETTFSSLQSLRLSWVEFFGKFYKGEGIEFKPIRVKRIYSNEKIG